MSKQTHARLVWLRNDLRVSDNPALFNASKNGDGVVATYLLCEQDLQEHMVAPARVDFIRRSLMALSIALGELNIPLLVLRVQHRKEVGGVLQQLIRQYGVQELFINAEYPLNEFERDKDIAQQLRQQGVSVTRFHDRVIIPPGMIRNGSGEPYKVFTAFKNNWLRQARALPLQPLTRPRNQPESLIASSTEKEINQLFEGLLLRDLSRYWPAGESEANRRLKHFIKKHIDDYQQSRDFPALEGTSTLSPYLAIGAVSPRQCVAAALAQNHGEWDSGSEGVTTWISELIWRDFYQHVAVDFPQVCKFKAMQAHTEAFPWRYDKALFESWCAGKTGIPIVDAAMRQLNETGWMHNRLRMVVAMFLSKNLQLDWRMGERYFMEQLIDGDFAANNGGWQWSASTGTDAAPYFRIFNPVSQSQRFDPDGTFIRQYVPELRNLSAKNIHLPTAADCRKTGYPDPIVDLALSRKDTIALFAALKP
jgi:deoxyribodipyrimidine photo-lyase